MLHKLLTFEVRREGLDQALALTRAFVDEVRRKEGGTARFDAFHATDAPTRFLLTMSFRTPSADDYHHKTAWRKKFIDGIQPLCAAPPRVEAWKAVEPG